MLVIADTGPLRYLIVIGEHNILPVLFGHVWVPGAVIAELSTSSTPEDVRAFVASNPAWLQIGEPDKGQLASISLMLDSGERAALALALEMNADLVLLDDAAGRREAVSLGLRITGTIGVLRLAAERRLINVSGVLTKLRASGFYIGESVIQAAFREWL
jgi:predicted nucleic acid-binding protein